MDGRDGASPKLTPQVNSKKRNPTRIRLASQSPYHTAPGPCPCCRATARRSGAVLPSLHSIGRRLESLDALWRPRADAARCESVFILLVGDAPESASER